MIVLRRRRQRCRRVCLCDGRIRRLDINKFRIRISLDTRPGFLHRIRSCSRSKRHFNKFSRNLAANNLSISLLLLALPAAQ